MRGYLFTGPVSLSRVEDRSGFRSVEKILAKTRLSPRQHLSQASRNYQSGLPSTETGEGSSERPVLISTAKGRG